MAWKRLRNNVIAQIRIPEEARRVCSLVGRKCRAEFAEVVALFQDDKPFTGIGESTHIYGFTYEVGKIVRPDSFNDDIRIECSNGIHFFVTRKEAEDYC